MRLFRTIALVGVVALLLSACGTEDHSQHQPAAAPTAGDGHAHSHGGFLFGEPGDPSAVTETIEVVANDFGFEPNELTVNQGDVIQFKLTNEGKAQHEFVLGDAALMEEMAATAHEHSGSDPNAIPRLQPGDEGTMVWNFTEPGRFRFECHVDAHHKLGMTGTITVMGS